MVSHNDNQYDIEDVQVEKSEEDLYAERVLRDADRFLTKSAEDQERIARQQREIQETLKSVGTTQKKFDNFQSKFETAIDRLALQLCRDLGMSKAELQKRAEEMNLLKTKA